MKRVPITEFKAHCSQLIEELGQDEIVITKHGKPVARVMSLAATEDQPKPAKRDVWDFYESLKGKYEAAPDELSTGIRWRAES